MGANKWTPGPWSLHEGSGNNPHETDCDTFVAHTAQIGAGDTLLGEVVAYRFSNLNDYSGWPRVASFDENLANAHLIAAAPELYDTLAGILDAYAAVMSTDACAAISEVLAKARGES